MAHGVRSDVVGAAAAVDVLAVYCLTLTFI